MKSVSRSIGLAFTINPYILQYVLGQITPVSYMAKPELGKIIEWRLEFSCHAL